MSNTTKPELTAAARRTLGNIIASGGSRDLTQGANRKGSIRKSVVAQLVSRGLVVAETLVCAAHGGQYPATMYYATAAGCRAFGDEIAVLA